MKSVLLYAIVLGLLGIGLLVTSLFAGVDAFFTEGPASVLAREKLDPDNDGLTNKEEKNLGTDPDKSDTDSDGLLDGEEVRVYRTNALNSDSDSDGYKDGEELKNGYDPLRAGAKLQK